MNTILHLNKASLDIEVLTRLHVLTSGPFLCKPSITRGLYGKTQKLKWKTEAHTILKYLGYKQGQQGKKNISKIQLDNTSEATLPLFLSPNWLLCFETYKAK